ncbi:MAG: riboflavin biosynthesis protein RibD, partial [Campylobacter sp.]|nr:riboflavin biosynthesis protein RibD [Campylobacter sp.]
MGDEFYLSLAIDKAWDCQLLTYPNPAVGAVILDENGQILSIAN